MIKNIWIRIAILLSLAVIPATLLLLKLQTDSVALVFNLAESSDIRGALDAYLANLREGAKLLPEREAEFKEQFQKAVLTKRAIEELFLAKESIDREIKWQTMVIIVATLTISLFLSFMVSRGIVRKFIILMDEKEKSAAKLKNLEALKNWQSIARVLVHELRAPITPIKLIATDIEEKFSRLNSEQFAAYLSEARALISEQTTSIEHMMSGFANFGKLPPPDLQVAILHSFIYDFQEIYAEAFGSNVKIIVDSVDRNCQVKLDAKLMRDLFFNICKNASEANQGQTKITIKTQIQMPNIAILLHNTGKSLTADQKNKIFDPYFSTKLNGQGSNMGLGLTIARKIALDHGGDLMLDADENFSGGVTFRLELPIAENCEP